MKKNYQTKTCRARTGCTTPKKARSDAGRAAQEAAIALPDTEVVPMNVEG